VGNRKNTEKVACILERGPKKGARGPPLKQKCVVQSKVLSHPKLTPWGGRDVERRSSLRVSLKESESRAIKAGQTPAGNKTKHLRDSIKKLRNNNQEKGERKKSLKRKS